MLRVLDLAQRKDPNLAGDAPAPSSSSTPYKIYNIGNSRPVELTHFIDTIEKYLGKKAERNLLPMQPGDVPETYADIDDLVADTGFAPSTTIEDGIEAFVTWYRQYPGA